MLILKMTVRMIPVLTAEIPLHQLKTALLKQKLNPRLKKKPEAEESGAEKKKKSKAADSGYDEDLIEM